MFLESFNKVAIMKMYNSGGLHCKRVDGTEVTITYSHHLLSTFRDYVYQSQKNTNSWPVFGTGTTPVKADDYTLAEPITSGISTSTPVRTQPTNDDYCPSVTYVILNTSASDVNINEIGLVYGISTSYAPYLFYREVLPSTVVIPPGGKHTFSFNFKW